MTDQQAQTLPYTYLPGLIAADCCPTTTGLAAIHGLPDPRPGQRVWVYDDATMLLGEATVNTIDYVRATVELDVDAATIRRVDQYLFPLPDAAEEMP